LLKAVAAAASFLLVGPSQEMEQSKERCATVLGSEI
jgi:hypothetical protein